MWKKGIPVGNSSLEKSRQSGNPSLYFSTSAWVTGIYEMPEYMHGELVWIAKKKNA